MVYIIMIPSAGTLHDLCRMGLCAMKSRACLAMIQAVLIHSLGAESLLCVSEI